MISPSRKNRAADLLARASVTFKVSVDEATAFLLSARSQCRITFSVTRSLHPQHAMVMAMPVSDMMFS